MLVLVVSATGLVTRHVRGLSAIVASLRRLVRGWRGLQTARLLRWRGVVDVWVVALVGSWLVAVLVVGQGRWFEMLESFPQGTAAWMSAAMPNLT